MILFSFFSFFVMTIMNTTIIIVLIDFYKEIQILKIFLYEQFYL